MNIAKLKLITANMNLAYCKNPGGSRIKKMETTIDIYVSHLFILPSKDGKGWKSSSIWKADTSYSAKNNLESICKFIVVVHIPVWTFFFTSFLNTTKVLAA